MKFLRIIVLNQQQNRMSAGNLNVLFLPNLLKTNDVNKLAGGMFVEIIIKNYHQFFDQDEISDKNSKKKEEELLKQVIVIIFSKLPDEILNIEIPKVPEDIETKPEKNLTEEFNKENIISRLSIIRKIFNFLDHNQLPRTSFACSVTKRFFNNDFKINSYQFSEYLLIYRILLVEIVFFLKCQRKNKTKNKDLEINFFPQEAINQALIIQKIIKKLAVIKIQTFWRKERKKKNISKISQQNSLIICINEIQNYIKLKKIMFPKELIIFNFANGIQNEIRSMENRIKKNYVFQKRSPLIEKMNLSQLFIEKETIKQELKIFILQYEKYYQKKCDLKNIPLDSMMGKYQKIQILINKKQYNLNNGNNLTKLIKNQIRNNLKISHKLSNEIKSQSHFDEKYYIIYFKLFKKLILPKKKRKKKKKKKKKNTTNLKKSNKKDK
ncbi:rho gtpase-activating protein 68f [Anaeramoeba flamelloides]|uniref:Rho gtpase-activating protein 68f n=1 Tax=Anaeramoeba flamelloides TaxID=1746091 RepID=A0ABQ8YPU3_9EUKA|nr:rho gtpase-activating protein 68f [Anaeramoeba flamelloides]